MTSLEKIPGIGKIGIELLEAAGFYNVESLAKAGVEELFHELERANRILKIAKKTPSREYLEKWIHTSRDLAGVVVEKESPVVMPVNYEQVPEVSSMLAAAPFAIPLPARVMVKEQIPVSEIPPAILLNRYSGDLEVKIDARPVPLKPTRPQSSSGNVKLADPISSRMEIDHSRFKSIEALAGPAPRPSPQDAPIVDDRVALIRGPKAGTNLGRNPESRRFIRGVLHSHPVSMTTGAIVTLLLFSCLPFAVISSALLLLSDQFPVHFKWVPIWILGFPFSLPILGLAYAIWGHSGSCRICGQKQFVPKMCLKNSKAHHIRGFGNIIPTCFHMILFRWFRCVYCGTPVRLKE
jgi:Domain of unknown function (DUF4332)